MMTDLWGVRRNLAQVRANAGRAQFAALVEQLQATDTALPALSPDDPAVDGQLLSQTAHRAQRAALTWLLEGADRYREGAAGLLQWLAATSAPCNMVCHAEMYPQDQADLMTAEIAKSVAAAAGWLGEALPPELEDALRALLRDRCGRPIFEGATGGCWWGTALNSNWTAVLNSGLGFAALTLQDREPEIAAPWLDYARQRTLEMLDLAAEEGAGIEGAGYWLYCFGSLQDFVEALLQVTGEDLYQHPFWSRCSRFLPYLALPDFSAWSNYADTGYRGLGGSAFFHGVAARRGDGLAQHYGNLIQQRHGPGSWQSLLYYDERVAEQPLAAEPPCRFFSSIHLASFRSGWDENAICMLFKGGSNAWSHTHLDLNSFLIYAGGERLATEPGPEPYSLAYWHSIQPCVSTSWHNCIVVDGAHQRVAAQYAMSYDLAEAGDCYSRCEDHLSTPDLELLKGDATTAYGDTLSRAWRYVVYLKPDVFVIYDDLLAHPVRAQRNFEWLLHSEYPLTEVSGGLQAAGERSVLHVAPVFPEGWEYKQVGGRCIPGADQCPLHGISIRPYWHHKWNVNPARSPYPHWDPRGDAEPLYPDHCRYLVVLSVHPTGGAPRYQSTPLAEGTARGVRLVNEDETVTVVFNPDQQPLTLAGLTTDAAQAVVRCSADRLSWAVVRGCRLVWQGETVLQSADPLTQHGETQLR
jgi:hypothetical protein